jgi:hypothetical protein
MSGLQNGLVGYVWSCFQSHQRLLAEIVVLRHQLNILRRNIPKRPILSNSDRVLFVWLYRLFPGVAGAATIIHPETVIGWHRAASAPGGAGSPVIGEAGPKPIAQFAS